MTNPAAAGPYVPTPYYADEALTLYLGDALDTVRQMPAGSIDAVVTSPPYYGLRDYGHDGQWGAERTVGEYVARLRALFAELRRVLVPSGAVWLNLGDSYAAKSLIGAPWRVALALQDDGWAIRNELVWAKTNPMPHPVGDRLNSAHETVFLLAQEPRYYFDLDAVREPHRMRPQRRPNGRARDSAPRQGHPRQSFSTAVREDLGVDGHPLGRNPGDVWSLPTRPCPEAHFAVMPEDLARRLVLTVCPEGGTVLDPFNGRGTTGRVARLAGRRYVGIDLNQDYLDLTVAGVTQGVLA